MRAPDVSQRLAVGIGLDLHWGSSTGFRRDPVHGDSASPPLAQFVACHAPSHLFVSWQPRSRSRLRGDDYYAAWDDLFSRTSIATRALHHTALNLGTTLPYDRRELFALTNALVERYGFAWINEDLGLWSLGGKPLPYPMPPLLTDAGLKAAIANVRECQDALAAPLVVEFPGFSADGSPAIGPWHAYDFLTALCEAAGAPATLDTGHLLSYQWSRGRRGDALLDELDRLPLAHAFEIHVAGAAIAGDEFIDAHHGRILDAQLTLCSRLLAMCPNVRAVTFEDPRIDAEGAFEPDSERSYEALRAVTQGWAS